MTVDTKYKSGKSEHDENFPVASRIVASRHRAPILAFYRFARAADDAADHPTLDAQSKLSILSALEETLLGRSDAAADALPLRDQLRLRNLSPQHALDLLKAFRQDVTKNRYNNWEELLDYCRYSAMPVGRFVLDVHGEPTTTWAHSDALCTVLQIINHLQDCGKDYRNIDRVYVPLDDLSVHSTDVRALAEPGSLAQPISVRAVSRHQDRKIAPRSFAIAVERRRFEACRRNVGNRRTCAQADRNLEDTRSAVGACPSIEATCGDDCSTRCSRYAREPRLFTHRVYEVVGDDAA